MAHKEEMTETPVDPTKFANESQNGSLSTNTDQRIQQPEHPGMEIIIAPPAVQSKYKIK